jgi:hypothetical protein
MAYLKPEVVQIGQVLSEIQAHVKGDFPIVENLPPDSRGTNAAYEADE